jgi:hypothetical protein
MSRIVFDEPTWWQRPRWRLAAAIALILVAVIVWSTALTPRDSAPAPKAQSPSFATARVAPQPTEPITPAVPPAPAPAPSLPAASHAPTQPPLSTMIAPGVHVTPLSVPPGTVPQPAGPSERDSESEN